MLSRVKTWKHKNKTRRRSSSRDTFIHSFIFGMYCQQCVAPNADISLKSGWFLAMSIASFRERLLDFRSCLIVFIHVVRGDWGHPGGLLQFSKGEAVKIFLASVSCGIRTMSPNRKKHRAWTIAERCGCPDVHLTLPLNRTTLFLKGFANATDQGHQSCENL